MPPESDENQDKPIDLVFLLAIAGRIDAQGRILAQELDKNRGIYYAYAALDSLSSSYSMFKYFFDVFLANNDPNTMHDIMMTPGGIIGITIETVFLVTFSVLATHYDGEKNDDFKKFIAAAWPYFRDVMKGLKNAYKGWRSAVVAIALLGGTNLNYLIAPVGLVLGVLAAANRFWLRSMVEARKVMMTANAELLLEIKKLPSLSLEESKTYLRQIQNQSTASRVMAYISVAAGGLIDGLYLYVGVLGLAVLSHPVFMAMASICAIYTVACIVTRLYEEYDFQQRLLITQTKCEIALLSKLVETSYAQLLFLRDKANKTLHDLMAIKQLEEDVCQYIKDFAEKRQVLMDQSSRSYFSAVLFGIKNGLYAYSALASLLFLVGTILVLTGTAFPPALMVTCVLLGLALMIGFAIHSVVTTYLYNNKDEVEEERPYLHLDEMRRGILEGDYDCYLDGESFHASIKDGLTLDPSPQFFYQEWFEVFRSLFSGFGKGQKFVDFAGNPLQELDDMGHYQDSPIMYILSVFSALTFGGVLALRALARGFGRSQLGQVDLAADEVEVQPANMKQTAEVVVKAEGSRESSQPVKSRPDSLPRSSSLLSSLGLFETESKRKETLPHSVSEPDLTALSPASDIIQGLS
ncbi:hypothetical protein [Legionella shakespearei]|uniref:Transmembrane protein n=1 Tax=Legionella shakespearei DSM 23087 TaxID=1122169 RepID=A0A0W0Z053_9GAMM|nr:hypothetical protein [Legionella shakespearei]KTD62505.1 transmembrane protein [Legionella shakespearei DSM 23087]